MRSAVNASNDAAATATGQAAQYGQQAQGINSTLTPFLTQRLNNPQGYSQQDLGSMLSSALGGAGGSTSGITGQANQQAARTRNDAGFSSALDDAARSREKNIATASEGISASNAGLKQDQQNNASRMLQGLYGTDVGAQQGEQGQANQDENTALQASQQGWLQNGLAIANTAAKFTPAGAASSLLKKA